MKRFAMLFVLLCAMAALTGCFHQQVVVDANYNASKAVPDYTATYFHIIGLVGIGNTVALDAVCPNGAGLVENKTYITINVLTIESMGVYCN